MKFFDVYNFVSDMVNFFIQITLLSYAFYIIGKKLYKHIVYKDMSGETEVEVIEIVETIDELYQITSEQLYQLHVKRKNGDGKKKSYSKQNILQMLNDESKKGRYKVYVEKDKIPDKLYEDILKDPYLSIAQAFDKIVTGCMNKRKITKVPIKGIFKVKIRK